MEGTHSAAVVTPIQRVVSYTKSKDNMNAKPVLIVLLPIALFSSCQLPTADKPAKEAPREPMVGRYQMVTTPGKTLKLDTATGATWFLDADSLWKPLPTEGS